MKSKRYFTIYDNSTDEIVASGFLDECAKQFGTNKRCMSSIISKCLKGKRTNYYVLEESLEDEEIDNYLHEKDLHTND